MPPSRRQLLPLLTLGAAALAPEIARAAAVPGPYDPWSEATRLTPGDPLAVAAVGLLAASPHNTQPWRFEVGADHIILRADAARNLGAFDPFRREMWIGLGCAVETMVQAGPALGFDVGPGPVGGAEPMPTVRLALRPRAPAARTMLNLIAARRTNRAPYAAADVAPAALARLAAAGRQGRARATLIPADGAPGRRFAQATLEATRWIVADPQMAAASHRWFRGNPGEVARCRDGLSIPTSGLDPATAFFGQILPPPDAAAEGRYWVAATASTTAASAAFGVIAVDDLYDRAQQLDAGRAWARLHLAATAEGLAVQPLNQLPEVVDRRAQRGAPAAAPTLADSFAADGGRVTFCFRLGHPAREVPHSARRGVSEVAVRVA